MGDVGGSPTHPPATKFGFVICKTTALHPRALPAHCIAGAGDPPCIISCVYSGNYTPQPQSGCLMTVAPATGGVATGRDPPNGRNLRACPQFFFFSKIAARKRNIFAKLKKEKRKIKKKKTKSIDNKPKKLYT